ncbi:alpha/beta hydrolase [Alphaproteobacteria bacterium]|nr:alpha/beta hydrolase [Alphaproteobacteria bacterium]MDC1086571.1 alpha/beta hydrolase [Alphaproteobacteria bacterium]
MSETSIKIGSKPSISVDYSGQGEMVLFLHGIGGNKKNWKNNINFFSKNFLTVAWDTRGYGDSDDYNGELNFDNILDDLKKVIDFFKKTRAHIVGLSMGGQIATLFYDKYPNYVKTLTLCDTHFGLSNLSPTEIEKFINLRKEPLLNGKVPKDIAPSVASTLIGDTNNISAYNQLVESMSLLHKESYLKTIESSMRTEHRHIFKNIKVPTLIMVGELDTLTPPSMSKSIMNEIKGSYLKIIPKAGHLINIEEPDIFNQNLIQFLDKHSYI